MSSDYIDAARKLDLFHTEEHSPGFIWWHPNGQRMLEAIKSLLRKAHLAYGYQEVKTPNVTSTELFAKSGHLAKFGHNMFLVEQLEEGARQYALRPMSCPNHILVYADKRRSYAELPLKLFEFGEVVRNEASGALQALFRMRGFCQDDAHVFASNDTVEGVLADYIALSREVYAALGFTEVRYQIALRPAERFGDDALWDQAENALRKACADQGLSWDEEVGGGAFYGPKLEMHLKDNLGRSWQCGTIQLDYVLPQRFDLEFVEKDNSRGAPVILHHAVLGSLERFVGILLENHGTQLPAAVRPLQVALVSVREEHDAAVATLARRLIRDGIRVQTVLGDENLKAKIKTAELHFPVHIGVIGDKEVAEGTVNIREGRQGRSVRAEELRALLEAASAGPDSI